LPLRRLNANRAAGHTIARWRVAVYFSAIGFGFMFLELAFIQKFILFLAHPLYAIAVVLCAFLVFAGLGSRFSHGILLAFGRLPGRPLVWLGIAIGMLAIGYVLFLPIVFREFIGLRDAFKIGISIALIAPLASLLGVPFPVTLSRVAAHSAALIPWAWAVNGCASVTGAVLATLLAMHLGFTVVVILAAMFYCLAVTVAPD
jgi:hypothetical protein